MILTLFLILSVFISPIYAQIDVPTEDAIEIGIADAGGYYTGTEVEAALQEIGAGTAIDHGLTQGLGDDDHPHYGEIAQTESITGLWNFIASGLGGLGDYDITIGDVATPDYGIIRIGDSLIGRTSYNAGSLDLDGSVIFRNMGTPATSKIEFVFTESGGSAIRFALAMSGAGNATYNPRSMIIAGPAVNNDEIVTVGYWQTNNNIFDNLAMDTGTYGADLGVQNDLEVEGDIFVDSIKESTSGAGVTFADDVSISDDTNVPLILDRLTGSQDIFQAKDEGNIALKFDGSDLTISGVTHSRLVISHLKSDGSAGNAEITAGNVTFISKRTADAFFRFVPGAGFPIQVFGSSGDAETQYLRVYGFPTGEALRYGEFQIVSLNSNPAFQISSDSGEISFADENLTFGGTVIVGATSVPDSLFEVDGAEGLAIETVTGDTTLDKTHSTLLVNASGNVTITLPTAASAYNNTDGIGRIYEVKKIDADANTVTIDGNGAELIEFAATAVLTVQGESIRFKSNGTAWYIL